MQELTAETASLKSTVREQQIEKRLMREHLEMTQGQLAGAEDEVPPEGGEGFNNKARRTDSVTYRSMIDARWEWVHDEYRLNRPSMHFVAQEIPKEVGGIGRHRAHIVLMGGPSLGCHPGDTRDHSGEYLAGGDALEPGGRVGHEGGLHGGCTEMVT